jgi:hypothetical protein
MLRPAAILLAPAEADMISLDGATSHMKNESFEFMSDAPAVEVSGLTRRRFLQSASAAIGVAAVSQRDAVVAAEPRTPARSAGARHVFSFLHSYEATGRYWRGLERSGLLRHGTGVRLVNSPWADDSSRFNAVARRGGELHRIISQRGCFFVIDRVSGGAHYRPYAFDQELIKSYAELLGENFLGGQVHETISNTHNDWNRFVTADRKFAHEAVRPDELRRYFTCVNAPRCLEYGTLDDYAGRSHPTNEGDFWREIEAGFRRESKRFGGHTSYCEGSRWGELAWHAFYRLGARFCLAELGAWASSKSQFAVAALRGAARAAEKPWGIFFAPWGPEGCTAMVPEKDWSWKCPLSFFEGTGWPMGPERGPSTALQRRIFFHAYLSGAWTLHEEWGAEGNLLNFDSGEISSYGKVTKALLDFQEAHADVGDPFTPLALTLDERVPNPTAGAWQKIKSSLFQNSPQDTACAARSGGGVAEADCYAPCSVPEVFDVVPADAPPRLWKRYEKVIRVESEKQWDDIIAAAGKLSPFDRQTHLPMQINRRQSDGAWIVGLYNPWGARRGDVQNVGSILDHGCTQREILRPRFSMKSARAIHAWPSSSRLTRRGDELEAIVGPGGTLVLEVQQA